MEQRDIPGDVLADIPEDAVGGGFGGAGAEDLGAGEPDCGDAVVLVAVGGGLEVEDDGGPRRRAGGGRGVGGGDGWAADGVGEVVVEDLEREGRDEVIGGKWVGEFDVFLGFGVAEGLVWWN